MEQARLLLLKVKMQLEVVPFYTVLRARIMKVPVSHC